MARKQVTIPKSYNVAGNDIGNHNLVSGTYNYEFWYAEIGAVKTILGETNYNLGLLCKSTNINRYAAFKPNRHEVPTQPEHYHGMWPDDGVAEPYDWDYRRPRGGSSEPYCLDHFLGYNHNAPVPGVQDVVPVSPLSWLDFETKETVIWDGFDPVSPYEVEIVIRLPEWDVRGFADSTNSIDRVWVKSYLDTQNAAGLQMAENSGTDAVADYMLTDTEIIARELDGTTFKFTPNNAQLWTGAVGETDYKRPFWMKMYLGNWLGEDTLLTDDKIYYANFPSVAGGVVEFAGYLQWRYYRVYVEMIWEKCGGGSGTGSVETKKDRTGVDADVRQRHYEGTNGAGDLLHGIYNVNNEGYFDYNLGIKGDPAIC